MTWLTLMCRRRANKLGELSKACQMMVCPGHEHSSCWRAGRCHMERGETETILGEQVDVGSLDLRSKTAAVAEAQVIGNYNQKVGTPRCHDVRRIGFCIVDEQS